MPSEFRITNLIDDAGRLQYNQLLVAIRRLGRSMFSGQFTRPVLIGTSLYQGELVKPEMKDMTMQFDFTEPDDTPGGTEDRPDPSGLQRAIYPLIKKRHSTSPHNIYTIGRTRANDMVMVDFAISRKHAQIRIHYDQYFLMDLKSTNGCTINEDRIPPNVEREFREGDEIGFGRYQFRFLEAGKIYDRLSNL